MKYRADRPIVCVWDGDHFIPLPRFRHICDQLFAVHEEVPLQRVENRSLASHNHYFASLQSAWENLNEDDAKRFPTPEALRAWALVEAGYATETVHVLDSPKDARLMAATIRRHSPLAILRISGNVVKEYQAESQSMASMKKERFEASKHDVLNIVASMARTTPAQLNKNAGKSA